MKKIPLTDNSGRWFDMDSAKEFRPDSFVSQSGEEVCRVTGLPFLWETLYLTEHGSFILIRTCDRYCPEAEGVVEMDPKSAVQWLIANGHQEEVKKLDLASEESQLEL